VSHLPNPDETPDFLLHRARAGDSAALGRLLELYRNYLRLLARTLIGSALRVRLESSDLVQETFLEAHRDWLHFAGTTEGELTAWLRRILVRNLADQVKRHQAKGRDWRRQQSLEALLDRSSLAVQQALGTGFSTPSGRASRREQAVLLADALAALPDDYREVIILRHLERLKFEVIAARMDRSSGAVRMLWARALERLNHLLENLA
jgi:RNA polymerase sigma-70 factor (ECF subfamily)